MHPCTRNSLSTDDVASSSSVSLDEAGGKDLRTSRDPLDQIADLLGGDNDDERSDAVLSMALEAIAMEAAARK